MNGDFGIKGSEAWTEKYRPKKFGEIVGQEEIIKRVKSLTNSMNIPHLLFAGPAGTGKSTLALITVRELFGESWRENYLELNASDERGIDVVRQKVKDFARTKAMGNVPFKVIFLDEADALTREAQQALRRTMENFTSTCRFILSCNYSSKIIDPIQSRCVMFRFQLLEKKHLKKRVDVIILNEGLSATQEAFDILCKSIKQQNPEVLIAPYLMMGATDARYLYKVTDNVYRYIALPLVKSDFPRMHGTN